MKQKICNQFPVLFSIVTLASLTLETSKAWGNMGQAPGLPIARFALPLSSSPIDELIPTGTSVGLQVNEAKRMLQGLETETVSTTQMTRELYEKAIFEINQYYKTIGIIEAKLQLGTTPANPQLEELLNKARQQLTQITCTIEIMNGLSQGLATFSQQTKTIQAHVNQALSLPGAVDQDHAQLLLITQALGQLDGEIHQILSVMVANINRQRQWLTTERVHFDSLSTGVQRGQFTAQIQEVVTLVPLAELNPPQHHRVSHAHKKPSDLTPHSKPHSSTKNPESQPSPAQRQVPLPLTKVAPSKREAASPPSVAQKQEPLPALVVEAHPKIPPLSEEKSALASVEQVDLANNKMDYATVAKGRSPLGIIDADQAPESQKWYLFSSAKRGLESPSDVIDIVSIVDKATSSKKGDEIKDTLVQLGLKPTQLRVVYATGDLDQLGKIYIFGK